MHKQKALELLGGTVSSAAAALGVSYEAVHKWPDVLPNRIAERVMGVYAKDKLPELATIGKESAPTAIENVAGA